MSTVIKERPSVPSNVLAAFQPNISNMHHIAYKCRDAEEQRHFYEDILGLKFLGAMRDAIPPVEGGAPVEFLHVFFAMSSGECIAFFDIGDGKMPERNPSEPSFVNHISMQVPDKASLINMWARLEDAGVEVFYMRDHDFCWSIYFDDPSGHRIELSFNTERFDSFWEKEEASARDELAKWNKSLGRG